MLHIFIINPSAGGGNNSIKLREELNKQENLQYFIFNIRYADYEKVLVNQILKYFDEDKLRIYVCGGLGTFHKVVNALDGHFEEIEIAWYPMGVNNNLYHVFSKEDAKKFKDITNLINGISVPIDYIRTNHGIAVNAFSTGVDAKSMETTEKMSLLVKLSPKIAFIYSLIKSVLMTKPIAIGLTIDGKQRIISMSQFFFGNGEVIGSNLMLGFDASITDGIGNYLICENRQGLKLVKTLNEVSKNRKELTEKVCITGLAKKIQIISDKPLWVNLDGEKYVGFNEWEAEIVPKGIQFVIPKEVRVP